MCGIFGILYHKSATIPNKHLLEDTARVLSHRGPDNYGIYADSGIGLVHTRLSLLDFNPRSNQPFWDKDGRYCLVYNGEVYNYIELREQLVKDGVPFRTNGDTEVVLKSIIHWGPDAFSKFNGMWALILLDTVQGTVVISRDRFGVKPLYFWVDGKRFFAASEIKGILKVADRKFKVSAEVANDYLCQDLLCVGNSTFFEGIEEFPAGHFANLSVRQVGNVPLEMHRYWKISNSQSEDIPEEELIESVRSIFLDAVKLRLRSDVGVGILLSGGIDSSAIAAAVHHIEPQTKTSG